MLLITVGTGGQKHIPDIYSCWNIIGNIHQAQRYQSLNCYMFMFYCLDFCKRLIVTLINVQHLDEPSIDGGGLFCEFLLETIKTGSSPNGGYFMSSYEWTPYPNTLSHLTIKYTMSS